MYFALLKIDAQLSQTFIYQIQFVTVWTYQFVTTASRGRYISTRYLFNFQCILETSNLVLQDENMHILHRKFP